MGELRNCPTCAGIFVKTSLRETCENCYKIEYEKFQKVYEYIRKQKNREANLQQVCEATGVEEETVLRFIRTGKIKVVNRPFLGYPCEKCGALIQSGRLCIQCSKHLSAGWKKAEEQEKELHNRIKEDSRMKYLAKDSIQMNRKGVE